MSRLDAEIEILQTSAQDAPPFQAAPAFQTGRARPFNPGSGEGTFRFSQARKFNPTSIKGNARMGIFSRTRDIIAANFNDMLDKAEDPGKMIRLIILEMEETLVEVRTSSARTIADQKELRRHVGKLNQLQHDWGDKAQLALSKDREDLARAALLEKKKAGDMAEQLGAEIAVLDDALRAYEEDIEKLQNRLREARSRQSSIAARLQSAENRVKLRTLLSSERVDEALVRFDQLERRVDYAEGRAEAMSLGDSRQPTLAEEIAALQDGDTIDAELAEMKRAMNTGKPASE
ncbi:phage shock protein PspA [Novosphingobium lindaniclasticum]|uniref:Phage-shock protein n=1 Tax=Novosphingobium lindaniclasticum LE124 TaxID=1096930 RepID=T0JC30_9SPHN|nr:phage shock protein PspA [Novosphingobium lindaniclasticum]EQB19429.1 phage-shock protein [Novosphingobium lindaniclasticum LE124]